MRVALPSPALGDVQVPRSHEHVGVPQPIPQPVQRLPGVDGKGRLQCAAGRGR